MTLDTPFVLNEMHPLFEKALDRRIQFRLGRSWGSMRLACHNTTRINSQDLYIHFNSLVLIMQQTSTCKKILIFSYISKPLIINQSSKEEEEGENGRTIHPILSRLKMVSSSITKAHIRCRERLKLREDFMGSLHAIVE